MIFFIVIITKLSILNYENTVLFLKNKRNAELIVLANESLIINNCF